MSPRKKKKQPKMRRHIPPSRKDFSKPILHGCGEKMTWIREVPAKGKVRYKAVCGPCGAGIYVGWKTPRGL